MIPVGQSELSVIQGFQALLPCAAQGLPEPWISWEKDGTKVAALLGKFTVLRSGELIIERAEVSGQPVCLWMESQILWANQTVIFIFTTVKVLSLLLLKLKYTDREYEYGAGVAMLDLGPATGRTGYYFLS